MVKNDGGHAFPWPGNDGMFTPSPGMSLRDWFAGMALQGALSTPHALTAMLNQCEGPKKTPDVIGREICQNFVDIAYGFADAMLEQREK